MSWTQAPGDGGDGKKPAFDPDVEAAKEWWPPALSDEEEALRKRAGRLLESLRRMPEVLFDHKAWENEHELCFSLFRRGAIDGAGNGMLEAPIYNNRQIENAWLFLVEMRRRHPNRKRHVQECATLLGSSYNWSMVLHGSRKLFEALRGIPSDQAAEVLQAADAPELLDRLQAMAAPPSMPFEHGGMDGAEWPAGGVDGGWPPPEGGCAAGPAPWQGGNVSAAPSASPWSASAPGGGAAGASQQQPSQRGSAVDRRRPNPSGGSLNPFVDPSAASRHPSGASASNASSGGGTASSGRPHNPHNPFSAKLPARGEQTGSLSQPGTPPRGGAGGGDASTVWSAGAPGGWGDDGFPPPAAASGSHNNHRRAASHGEFPATVPPPVSGGGYGEGGGVAGDGCGTVLNGPQAQAMQERLKGAALQAKQVGMGAASLGAQAAGQAAARARGMMEGGGDSANNSAAAPGSGPQTQAMKERLGGAAQQAKQVGMVAGTLGAAAASQAAARARGMMTEGGGGGAQAAGGDGASNAAAGPLSGPQAQAMKERLGGAAQQAKQVGMGAASTAAQGAGQASAWARGKMQEGWPAKGGAGSGGDGAGQHCQAGPSSQPSNVGAGNWARGDNWAT